MYIYQDNYRDLYAVSLYNAQINRIICFRKKLIEILCKNMLTICSSRCILCLVLAATSAAYNKNNHFERKLSP